MSLSQQCHLTGKLSMGYTVEQQALGLQAAIAAGYDSTDVVGRFLPIWEFQIQYRDEYPAELDTIQYPGPYLVDWGSVDDTSRPAGVPLLGTRDLFTNTERVQGPNSINAFMAAYNAAMHKSNAGATRLSALLASTVNLAEIWSLSRFTGCSGGGALTHLPGGIFCYNGNQYLPDGSGTDAQPVVDNTSEPVYSTATLLGYHYPASWVISPNSGTIFQYNACSILAQEILTTVLGSNNPSSIRVSDDPMSSNYDILSVEGEPPSPQHLTNVEQTRLVGLSRAVMGIEFWDFMHVDGTGRRVPAFVCPVIPDDAPPITYLPGDSDPDCDYDPYPPYVSPIVKYPDDPDPGIGGGWPGPGPSPDVTFLLHNGTQGLVYPLYKGLLAYDLALKKWGKAALNYYHLVDFSPVNTNAGKIVTTQRFGMEAAAYLTDQGIWRFDEYPTDSYIKYGKIGMYRLGFTTLEEIRITFRRPVNGSITVASSIDGRNPEEGLVTVETYSNATWCNMGLGASGKWHTITITGNYDITHLEYVGYQSGRR